MPDSRSGSHVRTRAIYNGLSGVVEAFMRICRLCICKWRDMRLNSSVVWREHMHRILIAVTFCATFAFQAAAQSEVRAEVPSNPRSRAVDGVESVRLFTLPANELTLPDQALLVLGSTGQPDRIWKDVSWQPTTSTEEPTLSILSVPVPEPIGLVVMLVGALGLLRKRATSAPRDHS